MSSSIFDPLYSSYNNYYPSTIYSEGDKKFEEIGKDNILYYISRCGEIEEIISNGQLKHSNGKLILSTIRKGKRFIVNFGTLNVANVLECYKRSMVWFENGYLGTNRQSIIKQLIKEEQEKIEKVNVTLSSLKNHITKLNELNRNMTKDEKEPLGY